MIKRYEIGRRGAMKAAAASAAASASRRRRLPDTDAGGAPRKNRM
jgi:hypothetical protein